MSRNLFFVIGVVLLVLAAVFYFANIMTGSLLILVILGVLSLVTGLYLGGRP